MPLSTHLGNIIFTNLGNGFMMKAERRAESNEPIAQIGYFYFTLIILGSPGALYP